MKVAIIYGRFQPLSKAHYEMIKQAIKKYDEVFVLPVQGVNAFTSDRKTERGIKNDMARKLERNPLPAGIRQSLILKSFPQLDDRHVLKSTRGNIIDVYKLIKNMYPQKDLSDITIIAGADEYEEYLRQTKYMQEEFPNVKVSVKQYESESRSIVDGKLSTSISGTQLRKLIISKTGYEKYLQMIAPPLANKETFEYLQKVLLKVQKKQLQEQISNMFGVI